MEKKDKKEKKNSTNKPTKKKKKGLIITLSVIGGVLLIGAITALGFFFSGGGKVIAVVNGKNITQSALDEEIAQYKIQSGATEVDEATQSSLYENLINKEIVSQGAEELGVTVTDEEVQAELEKMAEEQGTTKDEYMSTLAQYGYTEDQINNIVKYMLQTQKIYDKVGIEAVPVVEADVKAAYDTNKADYREVEGSHILFTVKSDSNTDGLEDAEALAKAQEVITKLNEGADFAELAKEYSMDTGTASNGGALGQYASKKNSPYVEDFTNALVALNKGEYTKEPVKSDYGYHVILATDVKDDYDSLKESIESDLYGAARDEKYQTYIQDLISNATIEKKLTFNTDSTDTTVAQ